MFFNVFLKEFLIVVNNRRDVYVLSNGNVYIKFLLNKFIFVDVEKKIVCFFKI